MTKSRRSKHFDILGEQVSKQSVYLGVAGFVVFIAAILGGGYYLIAKNRDSVPRSSEVKSVASEPVSAKAEPLKPLVAQVTPDAVSIARELPSPPVSITSLPGLLERHVTATRFDEVDGFILNGEVSAEGNIWDLTLLARQPNLYKLKTEAPNGELYFEYAYDGRQGWLRQSHDQLKETKAEFYMSMAVLESSLTHLAWSYRSAAALEGGLDSVLELRPAEVWNGHNCAVVVSRGILPFPIIHYIDTGTFEEVYRRATVRGMNDAAAEIELHFAPADGSTPHRLPMGYELYIDGKLHDTVT